MTLMQLLSIADAAYPHGILIYCDARGQLLPDPDPGDTLGLFIAREIISTYVADADDDEQRSEVARVIRIAATELMNVFDRLLHGMPVERSDSGSSDSRSFDDERHYRGEQPTTHPSLPGVARNGNIKNTWHGWVERRRDELISGFWHPNSQSATAFEALNDSRLCAIVRRLEREGFSQEPWARVLKKIARARGIWNDDCHRVITVDYRANEGLVLLSVGPMGVEVNSVNMLTRRPSGRKVLLRWADLTKSHQAIIENQGAPLSSDTQYSVSTDQRFIDL